MGTKLKHANEIIAWANGAVVQRLYDADKWIDESNPTWDEEEVYRIKPEPKPDIVRYMQVSFHSINNLKGSNTTELTDWKGEKDNVKVTFDGETNEIKAVELIK